MAKKIYVHGMQSKLLTTRGKTQHENIAKTYGLERYVNRVFLHYKRLDGRELRMMLGMISSTNFVGKSADTIA